MISIIPTFIVSEKWAVQEEQEKSLTFLMLYKILKL